MTELSHERQIAVSQCSEDVLDSKQSTVRSIECEVSSTMPALASTIDHTYLLPNMGPLKCKQFPNDAWAKMPIRLAHV